MLINGRNERIDGVKVFSKSKFAERAVMGEDVTEWMRNNPQCRLLQYNVVQSSDREFHCLSIVITWTTRP